MTEQEWFICDCPPKMLDAIRPLASERKVRLFGCACCRGIWPLLKDERSRRAVELAELYADGLADAQQLEEARAAAVRVSQTAEPNFLVMAFRIPVLYRRMRVKLHASQTAAWVANERVGVNEFWGVWYGASWAAEANLGLLSRWTKRDHGGWEHQATCVRDIFGNPIRPVVVAPTWLTSTVVALATGIYEERAFDRMPILADALQDAGCDNDDILSHCRDANATHVRGCWVVDAVLGKA